MRGKGRAVGTAVLLLLLASAASRAGGQTVMGRWLIQPAFAMERTGTAAEEVARESAFYFLVPGERAYNRETGMYVHYIDKGMKQSYASSVPNGMITNDIVSVEMNEGSTWKLFRDGAELVSPDLLVIGEPGSYVLEVTDGSGINTSRLSFRILTGMTNAVDTVRLPEGFTFEDVLFNGKGISINSLNEQSLSEDGTYEITFRCSAIDREYRTKIMVDREAPQLALSNVKNGLASGEVSLEDLNPEDKVEITRDGNPYELSFMKTIKEYGYYTVRVTDPAGNSSLYEFTIQIYLTISSLTAILMVAGVIAGIIWYAVHVRNHLRVR